jgi:AbiV family abortive infection protein
MQKKSPPLTIEQMVQGIQAVKRNAMELLREADYLFNAKMYARAYALAYLASEELSKTYIFLEASGKLAVDMPLNWKSFWMEITDHLAKATQLFLSDLAFKGPMGLRGSKADQARIISSELYYKARAEAGRVISARMDAFYCDMDQAGIFRLPSENITEAAAREMIDFANARLAEAKEIFKEQSKDQFLEFLVTFWREQIEFSLRIATLYKEYKAHTISATKLDELANLVGVPADLLEQSLPQVLKLQLRMLKAMADPDISRKRLGRKSIGITKKVVATK